MLRSSLKVVFAVALVSGCSKSADSGIPPENLDIRIDQAAQDNDPDSYGTQMCVNENGEVFVVWLDTRDGTDDVWFNRSLDLGLSWMPSAVKLNRGIDNNVWNPAIACNTKGVYVVWEDDRDGELQNHNIYFNRSLDGGETWAENDKLLELDEDGNSFSQGPQIVSAGDDLYVVWYDNLNGAADIISASSGDNGKTWGDPVRVDSDEPAGIAFSGSPRVAATETGNVYVVWEDTRNGNSDIYFARSDNAGSSFKPDTRLDGGEEAGRSFSFSPQIAADGDNVYVTWHDARNAAAQGEGGRDIYMNYSSNAGKDWSNSATRADTDNAGFFNSLFPKVQVVGSTGYIAWSDNRNNSTYDIYLRVFDNGEPQGDEFRVDVGSEAGQANSTDVVMATNGVEVVVGYEDQRNGDVSAEEGYNDLFYNYVAGGSVQDPDLRIDTFYPANSFKTDLHIALHQQLVYATWTDGRLGSSDVFFKKLALGEEGETLEGEEGTAR